MLCHVVFYSSYVYLSYFTRLVIFVFFIVFLLSCLLFLSLLLLFLILFIIFYFGILLIFFLFISFIGLKAHFGLNLGPNWPRTGPTMKAQRSGLLSPRPASPLLPAVPLWPKQLPHVAFLSRGPAVAFPSEIAQTSSFLSCSLASFFLLQRACSPSLRRTPIAPAGSSSPFQPLTSPSALLIFLLLPRGAAPCPLAPLATPADCLCLPHAIGHLPWQTTMPPSQPSTCSSLVKACQMVHVKALLHATSSYKRRA